MFFSVIYFDFIIEKNIMFILQMNKRWRENLTKTDNQLLFIYVL